MKRHDVILKDKKGKLNESIIISPYSARTLKKQDIDGLVAITATNRVSHPSPALLCSVLIYLGIDLSEFYLLCEEKKDLIIDVEDEEEEEEEVKSVSTKK